MHSKAQMTILLLILGVILVTVILVQFMAKEETTIEPINSDLLPVQSFVESCLKGQAESGLLFLGLQGGFNEPSSFQEYLGISIPIYVSRNSTSMPSLEEMQQELDLYLEDNLEYCLNNFKDMEPVGLFVRQSDVPNVQSSVDEQGVSITLIYPLEIAQGSSTSKLEKFSANVPFDLQRIHGIVTEVMNQQQTDPLAVHMGFLAKSAYDNDYFFEIIQLDDETLIYSFKFDSQKIKEEPYLFNFVARYDW